jgi:hypothetical protein
MNPAVENYQTINEWLFLIGKTESDFGGSYEGYTNFIAGAGGDFVVQWNACRLLIWILFADWLSLRVRTTRVAVTGINIASFLNKWVHIGAVYAAVGEKSTRLFINGVFFATVGVGQTFGSDPNPEIWLGIRPATNTGSAPGLWVDDIRVWSDFLLSDEQMAAEYASAVPVVTASLAAWFSFDADAAGGTAAVDAKHSLAMTMSAGAKVDVARTFVLPRYGHLVSQ